MQIKTTAQKTATLTTDKGSIGVTLPKGTILNVPDSMLQQPPQPPAPTPPPVILLGKPLSVTATLQDGRVMLSWGAVQGAVGYNIYRNGEEIEPSAVGKTTFEDPAPIEGRNIYNIEAYDAAGFNSVLSDHAEVSVPVVAPPQPPTPPAGMDTRIFADGTSVFKRLIAATQKVSAMSAQIVAELKLQFTAPYWDQPGTETGLYINTGDYSVAKFVVSDARPLEKVYIVEYNYDPTTHAPISVKSWTSLSFTNLYKKFQAGFRIPDDLAAAGGNDGHAFIQDQVGKRGAGFWQLKKFDGKWCARWGELLEDLPNHSGVIPIETNAAGGPERQGARATGLCVWGGVITLEELQKGVIDHPIACALPFPADEFVAPAVDSDGYSGRNADWMPKWVPATLLIPEGTLARLKASYPIPASASPFSRMVLEAMKKYGLLVVDTSNDRIIIYCENRAHLGGGEPDFWPFWNKVSANDGKGPWTISAEMKDAICNNLEVMEPKAA